MIIISDSVSKVVYRAFYKVIFKIGCTYERISGLFKTCSMMIFTYHFNTFLSVFLRQNVRYFMQNIVYLYIVCDVLLCKNLYRIALFLWVEWVKYCGKVWVFLSDL